ISYFLGIILLAAATTLMVKADFGVSMVVAPAYILHLKVSEYYSFFTFGVAEYILQAFILIALCVIMKKFKISYLYSFITTLIYGAVLDGFTVLADMIEYNPMYLRVIFFIVGMVMCSFSISLFFHTYFIPEAYDLFVREITGKFGIKVSKFKTGYDCTSCIISIIMSFAFFGLWHFEGIKLGTIICTLLNGRLIGFFNKKLEEKFEFTDLLPIRKYFEK
ncbi:MAG: DUF6198 family protein, partial [Acutalibacteraceae bacterium]